MVIISNCVFLKKTEIFFNIIFIKLVNIFIHNRLNNYL